MIPNQGMVEGRWFALLRTPDGLPVLFSSRQDATENLDYDEYLVEVYVRPARLRDLDAGERAVLERRRAEAAKKQRPRLPVERKTRRGSVKLSGAGFLMAELEKLAPLMRQRFVDAINGELAALQAGARRPKLPPEQKRRRGSRG